MTLTKAHIIDSIRQTTGLRLREATQAVEALIEIIKSTLESGEPVLISGFGKFDVKDKGQRRGRNPNTGVEADIDARRVVRFKWSDGSGTGSIGKGERRWDGLGLLRL